MNKQRRNKKEKNYICKLKFPLKCVYKQTLVILNNIWLVDFTNAYKHTNIKWKVAIKNVLHEIIIQNNSINKKMKSKNL